MAVKTDTVQVALYCRVSSEEQAKHGVSLKDQEERLRATAALEKWDIINTYIDEGVSGGTDQRPQFQNLILDAHAGRFDLVVVTKIDRFFRNVRLLLNAIEELKQSGVDFIALTDNIDTRDHKNGNMVLNVLATMAEWERERIGERVADFRRHLAAKGRWSSGRPPFGYRFNKETKELEVYEPEATAIRYAFELYTGSEQIGIIKLAELLNKSHHMPPVNDRKHPKLTCWTQTNVRHVLTRPSYLGGPNDKWQFNTPAIVTSEIWYKAQKRLSQNRHFKSIDNRSPLQGLLKCGICGHSLAVGYNHDTVRVWECPGRRKANHLDGSERCTLPRFNLEKLESQITLAVHDVFKDEASLKRYVEITIKGIEKERDNLEHKLKPMRSNVKQIQDRMERADTMFELGRLTPVEYKARIAGLRAKLKENESLIDNADPLMLRQLEDLNKSLGYWRSYIEVSKKWSDFFDGGLSDILKEIEAKNNFIKPLNDSKFKEITKHDDLNPLLTVDDFKDIFTSIPDPEVIDHPLEVTASQLRKLELSVFVYPKKLELKGMIRQSDILPTYKSNRCRQFQ